MFSIKVWEIVNLKEIKFIIDKALMERYNTGSACFWTLGVLSERMFLKMLVSLAEIVNKQSGTILKEFEFGMSELPYHGNTYKILEKSPISLLLIKMEKKVIRIEVDINLTFLVPCDRCLEEVPVPLQIAVVSEVDLSKTEAERMEALDETSYIDGYDFDVDRFLYEEVLVAFPAKVLCSEECKGICKTCGVNQNNGKCECDNTEPELRMSVIRDLIESFQQKETERNQQ